jgi:probable selenium-dependent hydroxylase accessory protein YqeC
LKAGGVISLVGAGGKTSLMFRMAREFVEAGESVMTTTTTKILVPTRDQASHVILSTCTNEILKRSEALLKKGRLHVCAGFEKSSSQGKLTGFDPDIIAQIWQRKLFRWILVEADGAAGRPIKAPATHEPVIPNCSSSLIGVVGLDGVGKPLNEKWVFRPQIYSSLTNLPLGDLVTEDSVAISILHPEGIFKGAPKRASKSVFLNKADLAGCLGSGRGILESLRKQGAQEMNRVVIGTALWDPPTLEWHDMTPRETRIWKRSSRTS